MIMLRAAGATFPRHFWLGVVASAGCFPGPIDQLDIDSTSATTDSIAAGDSNASEEVVPTGDCERDADCAYLDTDCARGRCGEDQRCNSTPLTSSECDDGDPCTKDDTCEEGDCRGQPYTCRDDLSCTEEACDGKGGCLPELKPDTCFIDGKCYSAGQRLSETPCLVCESGTSWSQNTGLSCNDNDSCSIDDQCTEGVCGGRAPDDAPGDWLVFPLLSDASSSASIDAILRSNASLFVLGSFYGSGTFANGKSVGRASSTSYLASFTHAGAMEWVVLFDGAPYAQMLGLDVTGKPMITLYCESGCTVELGDDTTWTVPTTPDRKAAILHVNGPTNIDAIAVSDMPTHGGPLDTSFLALYLDSPERVVRGADGSEVTFTRKSTKSHIGLVHFDHQGVARYGGEVYLDDEDVGTDTSYGIGLSPYLQPPNLGAPTFVITSSHRVLVSRFSTPLVIDGAGRYAALLEMAPDGLSAVSKLLINGLDTVIPGPNIVQAIVPSPTGFVVIGSFVGKHVSFGEGGALVEHESKQTINYDGFFIGAGGEAYFARVGYPSLDVESVSFIISDVPSSDGFLGGYVSGAAAYDGGYFALVGLQGSLLEGADLIPGPLLIRADEHGERIWRIEGEMGLPVGDPSGALFIAGSAVDGGVAGVGPSKQTVETDAYAVGWIQKVNSAGQLSCGLFEPAVPE